MSTICNLKEPFSFRPATFKNQKPIVIESNMKGKQITAIKAVQNFIYMVINCYIAYFRTGNGALWCANNLPVGLYGVQKGSKAAVPVHRYFFTGAPVKFNGGPLNITGAQLYFTGTPLYLPVDC